MPPKNKYWKDHEARFVANVVQETAALPTRKRKKNYPKGASPPQSESDGEEDTQKTPAPTSKKPKGNPKQKKKKPKSSSGHETQPPPLPSLPPNPTNTKDSPSDSAGGDEVRLSGLDGDGENLFDDDPVVEFDPIATRGPFDSDAEEDSRGEVTAPAPSESNAGNLATEPPDTNVTAAESDVANPVTLRTPDASVAAPASTGKSKGVAAAGSTGKSKGVAAAGSTGKLKNPPAKRSASSSKFTVKSKKAKLAAPKRKPKRTEWPFDATSHPDVMSKKLELFEGGWQAACNICKTVLQMKRQFDEENLWTHCDNPTHSANKQSKENYDKRVAAGKEK